MGSKFSVFCSVFYIHISKFAVFRKSFPYLMPVNLSGEEPWYPGRKYCTSNSGWSQAIENFCEPRHGGVFHAHISAARINTVSLYRKLTDRTKDSHLITGGIAIMAKHLFYYEQTQLSWFVLLLLFARPFFFQPAPRPSTFALKVELTLPMFP